MRELLRNGAFLHKTNKNKRKKKVLFFSLFKYSEPVLLEESLHKLKP